MNKIRFMEQAAANFSILNLYKKLLIVLFFLLLPITVYAVGIDAAGQINNDTVHNTINTVIVSGDNLTLPNFHF